jgi:hypothetical protein
LNNKNQAFFLLCKIKRFFVTILTI